MNDAENNWLLFVNKSKYFLEKNTTRHGKTKPIKRDVGAKRNPFRIDYKRG